MFICILGGGRLGFNRLVWVMLGFHDFVSDVLLYQQILLDLLHKTKKDWRHFCEQKGTMDRQKTIHKSCRLEGGTVRPIHIKE